MREGDLPVKIAGEEMVLLPERAMYWSSEKALLIADPHWGKDATFRASGIPVPSGTADEAIARVDCLVRRTGAREVIFLGDLLHAREGRSPVVFASLTQWRSSNMDIRLLLIRGNHDRRAGDPPSDLGVNCEDAPYRRGPFILDHHPRASAEGYVLAGHVHPGVRIYGRGRQSERLPCFFIGENVGILPAFGDFTGLADISSSDNDEIYAIADATVIRIASATRI